MAVTDDEKDRFREIERAFADSRMCLAECSDKKTGKRVLTLCRIHFEGGDYVFTPLAKLFDGDPTAELHGPEQPLSN